MAKTRFVGALLIALGAAACTTDDGVGQGLLNQDDNTVSPEDAELRIIGPGGISSGGLGGVKQLGYKVLMICVHILSDTLRHHIIQPLVVLLD